MSRRTGYLRLLAALSAADGRVDDSEVALIRAYAEHWQVSEETVEEVLSFSSRSDREGLSIALPRRPATRRVLLKALVRVAMADGVLAPEEHTFLLRISRAAELEVGVLESLIKRERQRLSAQGKLPDYGPTAEGQRAWRVGELVLGRYEVRGVLGEGSFGTVFRVYHRDWDLELAVKSPKGLSSPAAVAEFEQEAEVWVGLGLHPNSVTCYFVRSVEGVPRVFAEFVDGESLHSYIGRGPARRGGLYEGSQEQVLARILDIAIQTARGIDHAHQKSIVHQDVKPLNMLISREGVAKVTDFGLARAARLLARSRPPGVGAPAVGFGPSATRVKAGTPAYASPEQSAGSARLSTATDVWSWAVSVLHMFTGSLLWRRGKDAPHLLRDYRRHMGKDASDLPQMPAGAAELLSRSFSPSPADRPTLAHAVAELHDVYESCLGRPYPREAPKAGELLAAERNNRAIAFLELGKEAEARAELRAAMASDPQWAPPHYNQSLLEWRSGERPLELVRKTLEDRSRSMPAEEAKVLRAWIEFEAGLPLGSSSWTAAQEARASAGLVRLEESSALTSLARNPRRQDIGEEHHDLSLSPRGDKVLLWGATGACVVGFDPQQWFRFMTPVRVTRAACDPSCSVLLTARADGQLTLWETATQRRLWSARHEGALSLSVPSRGGPAFSAGPQRIKAWDLTSGSLLWELDLRLAVLASSSPMAASPQGTWDLSSRRPVFRPGQTPYLVGPLLAAGVSSNGRYAAFAYGGRGEVLAWDASRGKVFPVRLLPAVSRTKYINDHRIETAHISFDRDAEQALEERFHVRVSVSTLGHVLVAATDAPAAMFEAESWRDLRYLRGAGTRVVLHPKARVAFAHKRGQLLKWRLHLDSRAPFFVARPASATQRLEDADFIQKTCSLAASSLHGGQLAVGLDQLRAARRLHPRDERLRAAWQSLAHLCQRTALRGAWLEDSCDSSVSSRDVQFGPTSSLVLTSAPIPNPRRSQAGGHVVVWRQGESTSYSAQGPARLSADGTTLVVKTSYLSEGESHQAYRVGETEPFARLRLRTSADPYEKVLDLVLSAEGRYLIVVKREYLEGWQLNPTEKLFELTLPERDGGLGLFRLSPDARYLVRGKHPWTTAWDLTPSKGGERRQLPEQEAAKLLIPGTTPVPSQVTLDRRFRVRSTGHDVIVEDTCTGSEFLALSRESYIPKNAVAISPCGSRLAVGGHGGLERWRLDWELAPRVEDPSDRGLVAVVEHFAGHGAPLLDWRSGAWLPQEPVTERLLAALGGLGYGGVGALEAECLLADSQRRGEARPNR